MKKLNLLFTTILMVVLFSTIVFASEASASEVTEGSLGFITLAPPLIAIILAFITKNVVISLFLGCMSGTYIIAITNTTNDGFLSMLINIFKNFIIAFVDFTGIILESLADPWNAGIVLQVLAIGGVVHLISKMGGARAIAEKLVTKAKTPRSAQIITILLGLIVFFDDYANSLIVGPIMRPVYDKMKISREKLAFVVDATAAPIAGIAIISTWIGYEVGLIQKAFGDLEGINQSINGFNIFIQTIPYRFYNIFMLCFVVIVAMSARDFGPMLKAERRTKSGDIGEENPSFEEEKDKDDPKVKPRMMNAIIPILALVTSAVLSFYYTGYLEIINSGVEEDIVAITSGLSFNSIILCFGSADAAISLFQSAVFASIIAIAMAVGQGIFKLDEAITSWIDGMKALLITGVILLLAWSLKSVSDELGTADYLITLIGDSIPKFILPSIIFVVGSCISFATGTSYGTMGTLMPLAVPLGWSIGGQDFGFTILSTSAVLTGAIFGDHCSPISDTTILSSMGSSCNHINHVNTQIPYALLVGSITILFGYIPAALGIPVFIIIPISICIMILCMRVLGKKDSVKI